MNKELWQRFFNKMNRRREKDWAKAINPNTHYDRTHY